MKCISEAEYEDMAMCRRVLKPQTDYQVRMLAQHLVEQAAAAGFVVTIDQESLQPLAMGHYKTVVSVRAARSRQ